MKLSHLIISGLPKSFTLWDAVEYVQPLQEVRDGFEARYSDYCKVLEQMSKFLSSQGIRMMVLKGYACALDWPRPEHRPCGDIDLWAFGRAQEVEDAVIEGRGIDVTTDRHHYSSFRLWKFLVDNHYTLINTYHHKANLAFEQILEKLAEDDSHSVDLAGERIYLPLPDLHAFFLLKHAFSHFAASLFPELRFSPVLKDRVLIEIISPSGASTWKHRLCYR